MSNSPVPPLSSGFEDEERRRQLSEELARAEKARRDALLAVAEAEARAAQVRLDLARARAEEKVAAPQRVDPLYGVMAGSNGPPVTGTAEAEARFIPTGGMGQRRAALLERFIERDTRPSRTPWYIAAAVLVGLIGTALWQNRTSLVDAGDEALARFVEPHIREPLEGMATMAAPELLANEAAAGVLFGYVESFLPEILAKTPDARQWGGAPASWLTPEYRVRPTEYPSIRTEASSLTDAATSAVLLMPSLAQAEDAIRTGFAAAGVNSEGLTQDALRTFQSVERVILAQLEAQGAVGRAMAELDAFLRTHQGAFTYRSGEYSHRDVTINAQAVGLEERVVEATNVARAAQALAENTIRDLGIRLP